MVSMNSSQTHSQLAEIRHSLQSILGEERVLYSLEELIVYECDGLTLHPKLPDFVVFPSSTEEIIAIVEIAKKYHIPFLPGGRVPV